MIKYICMAIITVSLLFGSNLLNSSSMGIDNINNLSLKDLKNTDSINKDAELTFAKYKQMLSALKNAYRLGDKGKSYLLGIAYEQKHILKDRIVDIDRKKAIYWFQKGLDDGYGLPSIHLAFLKYISTGKIFSALSVLEEGFNKKFNDFNSKTVIALAYGTIVLDKLPNSKKYVSKAIDLLYPIASRNSISTVDYVMANLLNLDNQYKLANKFLNSACNNPNVSKEIWNMCISGNEITVTNSNTGKTVQKNSEGCPSKKLMPGM